MDHSESEQKRKDANTVINACSVVRAALDNLHNAESHLAECKRSLRSAEDYTAKVMAMTGHTTCELTDGRGDNRKFVLNQNGTLIHYNTED